MVGDYDGYLHWLKLSDGSFFRAALARWRRRRRRWSTASRWCRPLVANSAPGACSKEPGSGFGIRDSRKAALLTESA